MRTMIAATALACGLGAAAALAQTETQGLGLQTGAVGEEVFIENRQEYHLLVSELLGI